MLIKFNDENHFVPFDKFDLILKKSLESGYPPHLEADNLIHSFTTSDFF
jgi:hypothetical protein